MSQDAPEVDIPAATRMAAKVGAAKVAERYEDGYVDLERRAVGEADRNNRRFLARKANTDVQSKVGAPRGVPANFAGQSVASAVGANAAQVSAGQGAVDTIDKKRMMVTNTGINKSKNSADILDTTSGIATNTALSDAQNAAMVSNSKFAAGVQVAGAAAQAPAVNKAFQDHWGNTESGKAGVAPTFSDRIKYYFTP